MARITTKIGLTEYIKSQLGHPTIMVEVTDTQIGEIIDDTVQKFTEYHWGTLEDIVVMELDGSNEYPMPAEITNIIKFNITIL